MKKTLAGIAVMAAVLAVPAITSCSTCQNSVEGTKTAQSVRSVKAVNIPLETFELSDFAKLEDGILKVAIPKDPNIPNGTRGASLKLSQEMLDSFRGKTIRFSCETRFSDVEKATDASLKVAGGKILMCSKTVNNQTSYQSSAFCIGSSNNEWKPLSVLQTFGEDIQSVLIDLGIQWGYGEIEFRNFCYEEAPNVFPVHFKPPVGWKCEYTDRVKKLPPCRGVMSPKPLSVTEQDLKDLSGWGANFIRWQMLRNNVNACDVPAWRENIRAQVAHLEKLLPLCEKLNIYVLVDIHCPPGDRYRNGLPLGTAGEEAARAYGDMAKFRMMDDLVYKNEFVRMWREIATRLKGQKMIYGYDLVNEPDQHSLCRWDYLGIQYEAAKAIREIDDEMPIIVCANGWSNVMQFANLQPLPLKNIIYQGHMYNPGSFTHQGVSSPKQYFAGYPKSAITYPSKDINMSLVRKSFDACRKFQQLYGARIVIGEFSATRWAPGADRYLEDVISVMEEYNIDWCYHAYREWDGWSVEHSDDPTDKKPVNYMTKRKAVLLKYFSRNIK